MNDVTRFDLSTGRLQEAGLIITPEQEEFLANPNGRAAVCVFGIPAPDCLYIWSDSGIPTLYQPTYPGTAGTEDGIQAVVLPLCIVGLDQDDGYLAYVDTFGKVDEELPAVFGEVADCCDFFCRVSITCCGETPYQAAVWDLWPIDLPEIDIWVHAARAAYNQSRIDQFVEWFQMMECGGEMWTEELDNLYCKVMGAKTPELRERWGHLFDQVERRTLARVEAELFPNGAQHFDPAMPPVSLPDELTSLWTSLQALSQRNWATLAKSGPALGSSEGWEFDEANRRLNPWL